MVGVAANTREEDVSQLRIRSPLKKNVAKKAGGEDLFGRLSEETRKAQRPDPAIAAEQMKSTWPQGFRTAPALRSTWPRPAGSPAGSPQAARASTAASLHGNPQMLQRAASEPTLARPTQNPNAREVIGTFDFSLATPALRSAARDPTAREVMGSSIVLALTAHRQPAAHLQLPARRAPPGSAGQGVSVRRAGPQRPVTPGEGRNCWRSSGDSELWGRLGPGPHTAAHARQGPVWCSRQSSYALW